MIIPHYEIIINHHFIQEFLTPTPTQALQALTKLSPGARPDRTGWLWMQTSGMNFPKVQGCAYLRVSPSPLEEHFLISGGGSKPQIHPAQSFPSSSLSPEREIETFKGLLSLHLKECALSMRDRIPDSAISVVRFKYGADLGLPPWGQGLSCS